MTLQPTENHSLSFRVCRRARVSRDRRYDGLFYSGAATTKIYCRPICPGRPPLESNTVFFKSRAQAEGAGFRPCLRCRPELAPNDLDGNTVEGPMHHGLDAIHQRRFHFPAGQRRDDVDAALGVPLQAYWKTFQLGFAKMLLTDTALPVEAVTGIAGFDTPREMLDALFGLYGRDPLAFRKPMAVENRPGVQSCALMLAYRPPLDWPALLDYFRARAVVGVEKVSQGVYQRSFSLDGHHGWFSLHHRPERHAVRLEVHASNLICLMPVVWRIRRMLGLDADPLTLAAFFGGDALLGPVWSRHAGLRVPVGWDAFEFAVRAVVGQLVSVGVAAKLVGNIVEGFGEKLTLSAPQGIEKVFPGPADLQGVDLGPCGLTRTKAAAIATLAREVVDGTLDLDRTGLLETFIKQCTAIRGIGEWTAHTIAMRGRGDADAFPASDLGIVKAMAAAGQPSKPAQIRKAAERWRPWSSYAAMLLWMMPKG